MESIVSVRDEAGNEIGRLPAETVAMDYQAMPWRADPCIGRASDGTLFAGVHSRIFESADEGRTWTSFTVAFDGFERMNNFGVLPDDTFLMLYETPPDDLGVRGMAVACSTDRGRTWDPGTPLDKTPYTGAPGADGNKFCALPDGTTIVAVTLRNGDGVRDRDGSELPLEQRGIYDYIYRSTDGGSTWGDRTLIVDHCSETSFLSLGGERLLAAIRRQRWFSYPNDPPDLWKQTGGDPGMVYKHLFLADSDNGGRTWTNLRQWTRVIGHCPGELVQLSDGRIVLLHTNRYPYPEGDLRARVSSDEGATWSDEYYVVSDGAGYSGSIVLDDDTIVTVTGNTPLLPTGDPAKPWGMHAVRWRLPD